MKAYYKQEAFISSSGKLPNTISQEMDFELQCPKIIYDLFSYSK